MNITKSLTLIGAGADQTLLDGNHAVQMLQIAADTTVTLQDLAITKGDAVDSDGGGIFNLGTLTLVGVSVTDNTAGHLGGGSSTPMPAR